MAAKRSDGASRRPKRAGAMPEGGGEAPLSEERIAITAVELLDASGVNGLTMRGLADRLGSGVMSLYWYVDNKEDVFDLALDAVLAYRPAEEAPRDWRGEVVHILEDWRACMLRHSWSASLLPRRALGPNILSRLERLSAALARAGVPDPDLNVAIWALWNHVMGATITRASFEVTEAGQADAQQRLTDLGERYPTIARSRLLLDSDWDGAFRKGVDFLLNGLVPVR